MGNTQEYGFYGRLKAEFPSQIIVDVSEVCNLSCTHCPHPEFKQSEHYSGSRLSEELNSKLALEVKEHGAGITQYIRYTSNGEPLIHPKIFEMLKFAADNSGSKVCLTTNGTLLTEERIQKLLDCGLHLVDISIDAFKPETYEKIRVKGDLSVTNSCVENLIKARNERGSSLKIVVSYIEQPENLSETQDFEDYWNERGADFVIIRKLHSAAGSIEDIANKLHVIGQGSNRKPCLYPWERVTLNARGNLAFCPADWVHGSEVCSYETNTIKDVWSGEFYSELRNAHLTNDYSCHKFCGQCPDWALTNWPDEGRSYANLIEDFYPEVQNSV